eukprot:COSAG01_NODE_14334_length_1466_cov_7.322604_3_plen_60_part_01
MHAGPARSRVVDYIVGELTRCEADVGHEPSDDADASEAAAPAAPAPAAYASWLATAVAPL